MKALFLCPVLTALPAFREQQEASLAPIAPHTFPTPPAVFNALHDEVSSIMSRRLRPRPRSRLCA